MLVNKVNKSSSNTKNSDIFAFLIRPLRKNLNFIPVPENYLNFFYSHFPFFCAFGCTTWEKLCYHFCTLHPSFDTTMKMVAEAETLLMHSKSNHAFSGHG